MHESVSLIEGRWRAADGHLHELKWKLICIDHDEVLIDMQQPLEDLHRGLYSKTSFEQARWWRRSSDLVGILMNQVGETADNHFFVSRLALARRGRRVGADEEISQVPKFVKGNFTCTLKGLVVVMLWFALARKADKEKAAASALMGELFMRLVPGTFEPQACFESILGECKHQCSDGGGVDGECAHVSEARLHLAACAAAVKHEWARDCLQALQTFRSMDCPCLKYMYTEFLDIVVDELRQTILSGKYEVDGSALRPAGGQGKRKRIDEHYKEFVINEAVKNKMAKSGRAYLRAVGGTDPSLASKWEAENMLHYATAASRGMNSARQVSIAEDAARLGDPPEETLICLVWTPQGNLGVVPPPQVALPSKPLRCLGKQILERCGFSPSGWVGRAGWHVGLRRIRGSMGAVRMGK